MSKLAPRSATLANERPGAERGGSIMTEKTNKDAKASLEQYQLSFPLPREVFEQIDQEITQAGGEWSEPPEYADAVGRTMFDLPNSEDNTVTVLLPRDEIHAAPSQALVRIRSVSDNRKYLGIVVGGPFAEPDGLRGDAPIMITTAVRGGIFMPRYHGRVQVELLGEELGEVIIPPRLRPLPNSPVFVLDTEETSRTLRLGGDIPLGVPVGYEQIMVAIPSDKKMVLPRHLGILGTTGGGKSTTVSLLVSGFQQSGLATVVIDTEGEYTEIYQPTQDPTMLTALEKRDKKALGVEHVSVYHLIGRETTCPEKRRTKAFSLQFSQLSPYLVMGMLDLNDAQQQRYQKAYDIAKRILWDLKIFDNEEAGPLNYKDLTAPGSVSIIDLSDTDSPQINNLVIAEFLRGLLEAQNENYREAEEGSPQRRTMIIIEEAHEFLSAERIQQMPILYQQVARIARRGRKRWLGLAFVTQLPQHLPDEVLGLVNNYILHKIGDANVISRLKRSLGVVDDSLWSRLPNLAPGQALVAMSSFARPLLINIDPSPCKLRMVE